MGFNQENRLLKMTGALADDEVFVTGFSGQETVSRMFGFQVQFFCTNLGLKPKDIIGKKVTIEVERLDETGSRIGLRYFNGYVNRLRAGNVGTEATQDYREYRIEVVPWLWFLTQTSRCHIFVEMSVKDILEEVLNRGSGEYHVTSQFDSSGLGNLSSRILEQCVQYRETDYNFLCRMFEQYGIYFYFKHSNGQHELVLGSNSNYPQCEEATVDFPGRVGHITDNCIARWEHAYDFVPGKWSHTDYDFKNPLTNLETNSPKISPNTAPDVTSYEMYDFPGEYTEKGDGQADARVRQEEQEVPHDSVQAASSCKTFTAGHKFKLNNHPDALIEAEEVGEYMITTIAHAASQPYQSTSTRSQYSNHFTCIPASIVFRPKRSTPKPVISGIQTGVVTGPEGEEIYTDEYGRVKVFFHWDRVGRETMNETTSMWVRCAQNVAGRKWGFMAIPRIGQEVVVEFLEGDPDRPLVVGGVYNNDQMPHYELPEHQSRTYIKTNSTKGGDGFNELMFEDKNDEEMIFMHAQKDMDVRVLNNSREFIVGHRHQIIGYQDDEGKGKGDQSEVVWNDKHLNVKNNQQEHIEGSFFLTVGHGEGEQPGEVHCDYETALYRKVGADGVHLSTDGDENRKIGGGHSLNVTGDSASKSMNVSSEASMNVDSKAGMSYNMEAGMSMSIKSGMSLVIESGVSLALKVGGSFVSLSPAGVFINGPIVGINSGGAAGSAQSASTKTPKDPTEPTQAELKETEYAHKENTGQKSSRD